MRKVVAAMVLALPIWSAAEGTRSEQARIDALLAAIETSGCRFERNGTQYSAAEGAAHLRMKLENSGTHVQTAAQFIEHIGTGSSQSARPYRVLCPGEPAQTSRQWLEKRLAQLRAEGK